MSPNRCYPSPRFIQSLECHKFPKHNFLHGVALMDVYHQYLGILAKFAAHILGVQNERQLDNLSI